MQTKLFHFTTDVLSTPKTIKVTAYHGDDISIRTHLNRQGHPIDLTGYSASAYFQPANKIGTDDWFSANAEIDSRGLYATVNFSHEYDSGEDGYRVWLQASNDDGRSYVAFYDLSLLYSPGFNPSAPEPIGTTLDFAKYDEILHAPFAYTSALDGFQTKLTAENAGEGINIATVEGVLKISSNADVDIEQTTSGISINGTSLQNADAEKNGLMTKELASTIADNASRLDTVETTLDLKADESDLDALETVVSTKASQNDLDALSNVVDTKAAQSDLDALETTVGGKAEKSDLDALSDVVDTKAAQSALDSLTTVVGTKASQSDLDALTTVVASKTDNFVFEQRTTYEAQNTSLAPTIILRKDKKIYKYDAVDGDNITVDASALSISDNTFTCELWITFRDSANVTFDSTWTWLEQPEFDIVGTYYITLRLAQNKKFAHLYYKEEA